MHALDDFDKQILRVLQINNRITTDELSKMINLSQSAVQRRMTKLRGNRVIEADVSIISPSAAGIGILCVVDVILNQGTSKAIDKIKLEMQSATEVSQCYYVTGTYDFVLLVNARDMAHFEQFSKKYLMDNPHLKHFYTHVVMDKVKVGYGVSL